MLTVGYPWLAEYWCIIWHFSPSITVLYKYSKVSMCCFNTQKTIILNNNPGVCIESHIACPYILFPLMVTPCLNPSSLKLGSNPSRLDTNSDVCIFPAPPSSAPTPAGVVQFNAILTPSTQRWHWIPQVRGSVPQDCPSPRRYQAGCHLGFWPTSYKPEVPKPPFLGFD